MTLNRYRVSTLGIFPFDGRSFTALHCSPRKNSLHFEDQTVLNEPTPSLSPLRLQGVRRRLPQTHPNQKLSLARRPQRVAEFKNERPICHSFVTLVTFV
jgi:hypothetical protein